MSTILKEVGAAEFGVGGFTPPLGYAGLANEDVVGVLSRLLHDDLLIAVNVVASRVVDQRVEGLFLNVSAAYILFHMEGKGVACLLLFKDSNEGLEEKKRSDETHGRRDSGSEES